MAAISLGIAGYMGAGKTTYARALSCDYRVSLIDADSEAKRLMNNNSEIKFKIRDCFGNQVFINDCINYRELGRAAFSSIEKIKLLNSIVHPPLLKQIYELLNDDCAELKLVDAALIPLWNIEKWFNILLWINASFETRFQRIKHKSGMGDEELKHRMSLQQKLFNPPDPSVWVYVENKEGSDLGESLEFVKSKIDLIF
jgi:dephospho-CoA kinase